MKKNLQKIGHGIKKHKKLTCFLLIVLILGGAAGTIILPRLGKRPDYSQAFKENTTQLSKMDLTSSVSATGTIESAKSKTVSANATNMKIKSVKVTEGDTVKKGQTLVTFDEADLKEALTEANR